MTLSALRPSILLECAECQKGFRKERKEYDRQARAGRSKFYCGHSCSCAHSNRISPRIESIKNFQGKNIKVCDDLSPFRYYTRKCRMRNSPIDQSVAVTEAYLTQLWADQEGRCALTGLKLVLNQTYSKGSNDLRTMASLDRIDSAYPYQIGNVQFVSASMNYAKSTMSNAAMLELIAAIRSGEDLC